MASLNRATLIGNLGADPEFRTLNSGDRICNLRLATSETWKDRSGERKERVEWHRITIYNEHLVKIAEQYLTKGKTILIEGAIQTRKWKDNAGQDKYSTEIVLQKFHGQLLMLGGKRGENEGSGGGRGDRYEADGGFEGDRGGGGGGGFEADLDDEVPFATKFSIR